MLFVAKIEKLVERSAWRVLSLGLCQNSKCSRQRGECDQDYISHIHVRSLECYTPITIGVQELQVHVRLGPLPIHYIVI